MRIKCATSSTYSGTEGSYDRRQIWWLAKLLSRTLLRKNHNAIEARDGGNRDRPVCEEAPACLDDEAPVVKYLPVDCCLNGGRFANRRDVLWRKRVVESSIPDGTGLGDFPWVYVSAVYLSPRLGDFLDLKPPKGSQMRHKGSQFFSMCRRARKATN